MFCIIAFVVLSILGIFSASNRVLAREALDCVFRRITLRPCNTGFDQKMKAKLLGVVITRSEKGARLLNKYFEHLAWIFFVLLLTASFFAVRGVYLFYVTGSCNGLNQSGFCLFDPTGKNNEVTPANAACSVPDGKNQGVTLEGVDLAGLPVINPAAEDQIVFIGCYACKYSRQAYPLIRRLADNFNTGLTFAEYPTKLPTPYLSQVVYCVNRQSPDSLWALNDVLFSMDVEKLTDEASIDAALTDLGLDAAAIAACAVSPETETAVKEQMAQIEKTRFYGTPTVFLNGEGLVGPKPYRVYAIQLKGLFYWLK